MEPSSRGKILEVAEARFAQRDFAGVGMREVALAAGLGKSSLFHHFPSKASLYVAVIERVIARIEAHVLPEGVVRTASERGGRTFFNFGGDFRTDFTASAARSDFRRWRSRPEPHSFAGKRVQIRGLVEWINGPSIELTHELQLRVLD